jgi:hypothetical protein
LYVTVLKPFESTCTVETLGEGTADATSKLNRWSADTLKVKQYAQIQKLQLQDSSWQDSGRWASIDESEISVFA